jgi:tetratricopeptide (TPR) repeat protein
MSTYTGEEVARILNVNQATLRSYLRATLFPSPGRKRVLRYTFQDLLLLKTAKRLCEAEIPVGRIRRILQSLKRQLPPDQQLCNVRIYADGRRVVVWDGNARWQPDSGQFLFDFDSEEVTTGKAVRAMPGKRSYAPARTARQWFELGLELERHSPEEARQAYREAVRIDPALVDAHINLGLLHHSNAELDLAEQCYRAAIEQAPDEVLGHFNLAVILEEKGDRAGAIVAYRDVLKRQPQFAEAHYHLAALYEAEGRTADAIRHYATARKLLRGTSGQPRPRRPSQPPST